MGLGLSALTAIVLLLPGIGFVLGINRLLSPASPPTPFDQHFSIGLLLALLASLLLHCLGLGVGELSARVTGGPAPAPTYALLLLAGNLESNAASDMLRDLSLHPVRIALYFILLTVLGFGIGRLANRWVPRRNAAAWSEILSPDFDEGELAFVVLTAEVSHGGRTFLYSGFLSDYVIGRDGALERVVFRDYAARRPLEDGALPDLMGSTVLPDRWLEIPGETFVLQMRDVKTVNVDYFFLDENDGDGEPAVIQDDDRVIPTSAQPVE